MSMTSPPRVSNRKKVVVVKFFPMIIIVTPAMMANRDEGIPESRTLVLQRREAMWTTIMPIMASERAMSSPTIREGVDTQKSPLLLLHRSHFQ